MATATQPLIDATHTTGHHRQDEFADKLAKKLGQHYGLNDIRELLQ